MYQYLTEEGTEAQKSGTQTIWQCFCHYSPQDFLLPSEFQGLQLGMGFADSKTKGVYDIFEA
jgi:hypothetical protein